MKHHSMVSLVIPYFASENSMVVTRLRMEFPKGLNQK